MIIGWFIIFVLLIIIEFLTVNLVTLWFAVGAIAAIICSFFTDSVVVELFVFFAVSVITLLIMRPILKRFRKFDVVPTNLDRVIGKIGDVTRTIDPNQYGEVKVCGSSWTAASNTHIDKGSKVKILSIEGVKLIVQKEEK